MNPILFTNTALKSLIITASNLFYSNGYAVGRAVYLLPDDDLKANPLLLEIKRQFQHYNPNHEGHLSADDYDEFEMNEAGSQLAYEIGQAFLHFPVSLRLNPQKEIEALDAYDEIITSYLFTRKSRIKRLTHNYQQLLK